MAKRMHRLWILAFSLPLWWNFAVPEVALAAGFVDGDGSETTVIELMSSLENHICTRSDGAFTRAVENALVVHFQSPECLGNDSLRVSLVNESPELALGVSVDRRCGQQFGSEKIVLARGRQHHTRTFSVWAPDSEEILNDFSYLVYESSTGQIVDEGSFEVLVTHSWGPERVIFNDPSICFGGLEFAFLFDLIVP